MKRLLTLSVVLIPLYLFAQGFGSFSHDQPFFALTSNGGGGSSGLGLETVWYKPESISYVGIDKVAWLDVSGNGYTTDVLAKDCILTNEINGFNAWNLSTNSLSITNGLSLFRNISNATMIIVYKILAAGYPFEARGPSGGEERFGINTWTTSTLKFVSTRVDGGGIDESSFFYAPTTYHMLTVYIDYGNRTVTARTNMVACGTPDTTWGTAGATSDTDTAAGGVLIGVASDSAKINAVEFLYYKSLLLNSNQTFTMESYITNKYNF